jgi:hypothetical protein
VSETKGSTNNHPDDAGKQLTDLDGYDFHTGKDGIVWASYELRQSEIIQSTLLVQNIHSVLKSYPIKNGELIVIKVTDQKDVNTAIDFIWRSKSGLRLKSDWSYPAGQKNKSVQFWLEGR